MKRRNNTKSNRRKTSNPKGGKIRKGGKPIPSVSAPKKEDFSTVSPFNFEAAAPKKEPPKPSGFKSSSYAQNKPSQQKYLGKPNILPNDDLYLLLKNAKTKLQTDLSPIPPKDWNLKGNIQFLRILRAYHPASMARNEVIDGKEIRYLTAEIIMEVLLRAPDNRSFMAWEKIVRSKIIRCWISPEEVRIYLDAHDKGKIVYTAPSFDILNADLRHAATTYFFSGKIDYQKWYDVTSILDEDGNMPILFSLSELLAINNFSAQNYIDSGLDYLVYKDWENIPSILSYADNYDSIKELLANGDKNTAQMLIKHWSENKDKKELEVLASLIPEKFKDIDTAEVQLTKKPLPLSEMPETKEKAPETKNHVIKKPKANQPQPKKRIGKNRLFFTDFLGNIPDFKNMSVRNGDIVLGMKELVPPLSEITKEHNPEALRCFFAEVRASHQILLAPWITSAWDKLVFENAEEGLAELTMLNRISSDFFFKYSKTFTSYLKINNINVSDIANKLNEYLKQTSEDKNKERYNTISILSNSCSANHPKLYSPLDFIARPYLLFGANKESLFISAATSCFMPSVLSFPNDENLSVILQASSAIENNLYIHWNTLAFNHITSGDKDLISLGIKETEALFAMNEPLSHKTLGFLFKIAPFVPMENQEAVCRYLEENGSDNILPFYIHAFVFGRFQKSIAFNSKGRQSLPFDAIAFYNKNKKKNTKRGRPSTKNTVSAADTVSVQTSAEPKSVPTPVATEKVTQSVPTPKPKPAPKPKAEPKHKAVPKPKAEPKPKNKVNTVKLKSASVPVVIDAEAAGVKLTVKDSGLFAELIERLYLSTRSDIDIREDNLAFLKRNFSTALAIIADKPISKNITTKKVVGGTSLAPVQKRHPNSKHNMPKSAYNSALFYTDFLGYPKSFAAFAEQASDRLAICSELVPDLKEFYSQKDEIIDLFNYSNNQTYSFLLLPHLNRALHKVISGDINEGIKELGILTAADTNFVQKYVIRTLRQLPKTEEEKRILLNRLAEVKGKDNLTDQEKTAWQFCKDGVDLRPGIAQKFLLAEYLGKERAFMMLEEEDRQDIVNRIGMHPSMADINIDCIKMCDFLDEAQEAGEKLLTHWHAEAVGDIISGDIKSGVTKSRELMNIDSEFYRNTLPILLRVALRKDGIGEEIMAYIEKHPDSIDILEEYKTELTYKQQSLKAKMSGAVPAALKQSTGIDLEVSPALKERLANTQTPDNGKIAMDISPCREGFGKERE